MKDYTNETKKATRIDRVKTVAVCTLPMMAAGVMPVLAAETEGLGDSSNIASTATTALISSVKVMADSVGDAISQVIPIATPLVGGCLVVTVGLGVFKKITSKAGG